MKRNIFILFLLTTFSSYANETNLDLVISAEEIANKIAEVGKQISIDYSDKDLTVIVVMKGGICLTADLMRNINIPFKLEYLKASSYGHNGMTAGELTIRGLKALEIKDRDVLLVDDIFETGKTILGIIELIQSRGPKSIKTLALLVKDIPRETTYLPDYVLFNIPDLFVIGYGLDYKELYRGLPAIYAFPNNKAPF